MELAGAHSVFHSMHGASSWCHAILRHFHQDDADFLRIREMIGQFMGDVFTGVMLPLQYADKTLAFAANDAVIDSRYMSPSAADAFQNFLTHAGEALEMHAETIRARERVGFFVRGTLDEIFDDYVQIQTFSLHYCA